MNAIVSGLKLAVLALPVAVWLVAQQSRVHDAARGGGVEQVRAALKPWKEIDGMDRQGRTPLALALSRRRDDVVLFLIERGANPLPADAKYESSQPLWAVVSAKNSRLAQALLARGLDANSKFVSGKTWLAAAAEKRDRESVRLLLQAGADPNASWKQGELEATALSLALTGWNPQDIDEGMAIAEALIAGGARVSGEDPALRHAVRQVLFAKNHRSGEALGLERLKLVVEKGYPLEAPQPKDALLSLAALAGNLDAVRYLLSKGANPMGGAKPCREAKCPAVDGTPLHRIAGRTPMPQSAAQDREIAGLLIKAGADPATPDEYGRAPLALAMRSKNEAVAAALEAANPVPRDLARGLMTDASAPKPAAREERPLYAGHPGDPGGSNALALLSASGSELHAVLAGRGGKDDVAEVDVAAQGKTLTLLLASSETVEWRLRVRPGVQVATVIVLGRKPQRVTGQPPDAELVVRSAEQHPTDSPRERVYHSSNREEMRRVSERIVEITGQAPKSLTAKHEVASVVIDGRAGAVEIAPSQPGPPSAVTFQQREHEGKLSEDKLTASYCCAGGSSTLLASKGWRSGKRYWEAKLELPLFSKRPERWTNIGVLEDAYGGPHISEGSTGFIGFTKHDLYRDGDVFGIAIDLDERYAYFRVNGKWASGEPGSKKGMKLPRWGELYGAVSVATRDTWTANFGATPFRDPPPPGYKPYLQP
ncbi:MAG: hypothetical protein IT513_07960 [Burkholderiales bacterium]|nr:hypothetical protein [Burkholderiales bacterium]